MEDEYKKNLFSVDPLVFQYIEARIADVTISLFANKIWSYLDNVPAVEMIKNGHFEGWCWQSTTVLSVFLSDSDVVSRGMVSLPEDDNYFHSWIELKYKGEDYVFDPALDFLCDKKEYYEKLKVRLKNQILAKIIKETLIDLIIKNEKESLYIPGTNNFNDTFFRTNFLITAEVNKGNIKGLHAKFYSEE